MSEQYNKVAEIAANWWAGVVCNPKLGNGDESAQGAILIGLQAMGVKDVDMEKKETFKKELEALIKNELIREGFFDLMLNVDYSPCEILCAAAEKAEVSINNFPFKTRMIVKRDNVKVSYGYGAKLEEIYSEG